MIVRPQKRNLQRHRELVAALSPGDDVITTAGIYGTIVSIDDDAVMLSIAPSTEIKVALRAIAMKKAVVDTPEPTKDS